MAKPLVHAVTGRSYDETAMRSTQAADGLSLLTLTRRLTAIRLMHLGAGNGSPHNTAKVARAIRSIRRSLGKPPAKSGRPSATISRRWPTPRSPETVKGISATLGSARTGALPGRSRGRTVSTSVWDVPWGLEKMLAEVIAFEIQIGLDDQIVNRR